ncbi:MAG: hypothetical protein LBN95_07970 [Prevotellaceae bacterium]|jgi:hypothetical protein|nr:hypothetical protein [Prevotellaceae bacterium]
MVVGSKEYVAQSEKIGKLKAYQIEHIEYQKKITAQYSKMSAASASFGEKAKGTFSNLANGFNKYFGMTTAFLASITGVSMAFRKLATDIGTFYKIKN